MDAAPVKFQGTKLIRFENKIFVPVAMSPQHAWRAFAGGKRWSPFGKKFRMPGSRCCKITLSELTG